MVVSDPVCAEGLRGLDHFRTRGLEITALERDETEVLRNRKDEGFSFIRNRRNGCGSTGEFLFDLRFRSVSEIPLISLAIPRLFPQTIHFPRIK